MGMLKNRKGSSREYLIFDSRKSSSKARESSLRGKAHL